MMSNSEHLSSCCFVTSVNRGKGRSAFAGPLALSLFIHLVAFSVCALLNAQAHRTPAKAAVIEIDLSAFDSGSGPQAAKVPVAVQQAPAKGSADLRGRIVPLRSPPRSAERIPLTNSVQPAPVAMSRQKPPVEIDDALATNDLPETDVAAMVTHTGTAKVGTGSGRKGMGNRDGNGGAENGRSSGGGHQAKTALADYGRTVRALIERHKNYPLAARKFGIRGSVVVSFSLNACGELQCLSLAKSSGSALLDNAGMHAVRDVGAFPPPPRHAMHGDAVSFRIPITFAIAAG